MIFALVGNQNCGKTTLFNQLTGSNQHVGNFPGVTVDQKMGEIREHKDASVVDLPGIYSLRPYTSEEIVTRDFILNEKPDGIINIVDATNIERNLYLTLQLLEMHIPMVLALNMMDEVRNNGGSIDVKQMSLELGIPVIPISAVKGEGVEDLVHSAMKVAGQKIYPKVTDFCEKGPVHRCIHAVSHQVEDHAQNIGMSPRFAATKIVEQDTDIIDRLKLSQNELDMMEHSIEEMETDHHMDRNAALADMRYTFIEKVCSKSVTKCHESKEHIRSVKIDNVLTNKYLAIPLFLLIMLLVFWLTFGVIGAFLSDYLAVFIAYITNLADKGLTAYGINRVVHSLIIDGVFAGYATELYSNFSPVMSYFYNDELEDVYTYDVDKAKELMAEAGYEDGFDITITVPSNYQKHIDTAQVIAQQLKQINVNATIEPVEWGQWLEQVYTNADYQTTVVGLTGKLDPNDILGRYVSDYAKNFMKYNNPDYDKLIEEAKTASDEERVELFKECQKMLTDDAAAVWICDPNAIAVTRSDLKGYTFYPVSFIDLSKLYYEE